MSIFIERVANYDKNFFVNKRQLVICNGCYWCLSFLPDLKGDTTEYFDNCPKCNQDVKRMYISEQASEGIDCTHLPNIITKSEILVS